MVPWMFEDAKTQLTKKLVDWSPALQESHDYMVCCAAAGGRLRFYAVTRGGRSIKAISHEFDLQQLLDCLKVEFPSSGELLRYSFTACSHDRLTLYRQAHRISMHTSPCSNILCSLLQS